jgi:hypothetical protein
MLYVLTVVGSNGFLRGFVTGGVGGAKLLTPQASWSVANGAMPAASSLLYACIFFLAV